MMMKPFPHEASVRQNACNTGTASQGSIAKSSMLVMALCISVVVVLVSLLSYFRIMHNLERGVREKLALFTTERTQIESQWFEFLDHRFIELRAEYIERYQRLNGLEPPGLFARYFKMNDDGTAYPRKEYFNGAIGPIGASYKGFSGGIDKAYPLTSDHRLRLILAMEMVLRHGPGIAQKNVGKKLFTPALNFYIETPEKDLLLYWPGTPWYPDYKGGYDIATQGDFSRMFDGKLPYSERERCWTGTYRDDVPKVWMVSFTMPVDLNGKSIAGLGIDFSLADINRRLMQDRFEGTTSLIIREDGRLIAHPLMEKEMIEKNGEISLAKGVDAPLQDLYRLVAANPGKTMLDDPANNRLIAVGKIAGPGWLFVTIHPKSLINYSAAGTVMYIFFLGLLSLLIEMIILWLILRKQITRPLDVFVRATQAIAHGNMEDAAKMLPVTRNDELGVLAYSFQDMTQALIFAKSKLEKNESQLKGLVTSLIAIFQDSSKTIREFLDIALNEAVTLTGSAIGYIYFYHEGRQEFELNSWSNDVMKECSVLNYQSVYHLDKTGFWGEAVRQRKPVILNDFSAENALRKGYPEGHVHLTRFMSVPVFSNNEIVAVVGVANKINDYDADDVVQLTLLMNSVWKHVENKRGEIALKQEQERAQQYLDTVETMIVALDGEGKATTINRKAYQVLGYEEGELTGHSWFTESLHGPDYTEKQRLFLKIMAGETSLLKEYYETRLFTRNGDLHYIAVHSAMLRDVQGQVTGLLFAADDITERKMAEEERTKLESHLQQAQKMESIGRLAGGVAHDFNNMLTVILGHAQLGLMRLDPTHRVCTDLHEISKTAERSADLTRQLLAFARKQTIAPKVLDLNEAVSGILKMLQRLIGEDISLNWHPAPNLPEVELDPSQIDQVLANLCVNARDSITDVGKITIETGIRVIDEEYCSQNAGLLVGEYVLLAVSDNGCGMDKETLAHIFEPFFTTKGLGEGTGLGLATVYGIVTQNRGSINVYSEPGVGTSFTICLPRYVGTAVKSQKKETAEPIRRGQETILLVEDEPAILNVTTLILEQQGYTILAANSPGEAIRLAAEHSNKIHLLMTDVVMPEMNGHDLAKKLQFLYPQLKCLYMSGYTSKVIAHHGVLDTGLHFIQKPFNVNALADKLREVLET